MRGKNLRTTLFGIAAIISLLAVCFCFGLLIGYSLIDSYESGNLICRGMIIEGCIFFASCIGLYHDIEVDGRS